MTMFAAGITVTVKRPGGFDPFGNPIPGTTHMIADCAIAPAGSTEQIHDAATVEWDYDLLLGSGGDLIAQDTVLLPGDETTYQVSGRPKAFANPFTGWEAGMTARLKGVA